METKTTTAPPVDADVQEVLHLIKQKNLTHDQLKDLHTGLIQYLKSRHVGTNDATIFELQQPELHQGHHSSVGHAALEETKDFLVEGFVGSVEANLESHSSLSELFKHAPKFEVNLVAACFFFIRWIKNLVAAKVASDTKNNYSTEKLNRAMTEAIHRLEEKMDKLLVKDLASAKHIFKGALAHLQKNNIELAEKDFYEVRRLAMESYSLLNNMNKIVSTEVRLYAAVGCMSDQEFATEAYIAVKLLIEDEDVMKEVLDESSNYFFAESKKKNRQLKSRFRRLVNTILNKFFTNGCVSEEWRRLLGSLGFLF